MRELRKDENAYDFLSNPIFLVGVGGTIIYTIFEIYAYFIKKENAIKFDTHLKNANFYRENGRWEEALENYRDALYYGKYIGVSDKQTKEMKKTCREIDLYLKGIGPEIERKDVAIKREEEPTWVKVWRWLD